VTVSRSRLAVSVEASVFVFPGDEEFVRKLASLGPEVVGR